ncbi:MAG: OB-fold domain-containing protein [Sphingomonadaceae bacterium]|nr:OB-fold domain-containing protein [Sphingomonadaceae bacterium]
MDAEPYLRPLPKKDPVNAPFWEGTAAHKFLVPKCNDCGDWNWIPYPACRSCLCEDQSWTEVSGRGTVMSFSVVHRGPLTFGKDPYGVVLLELEERPRSLVVLGNTIDMDPEELKIGMPMKIVYEDIPGEDITMYRFAAL